MKKKQQAGKMDPEKEIKKLGTRIKALRIAKGYSSHEIFAYEHGIPRAQYGRYERGADLRYSSLVKVLNALGVTFEEFFGK